MLMELEVQTCPKNRLRLKPIDQVLKSNIGANRIGLGFMRNRTRMYMALQVYIGNLTAICCEFYEGADRLTALVLVIEGF